MKIYAPDSYPRFRCIADRCRHTCCVGWEIDIDPGTLAQYRAILTRLREQPFGLRGLSVALEKFLWENS